MGHSVVALTHFPEPWLMHTFWPFLECFSSQPIFVLACRPIPTWGRGSAPNAMCQQWGKVSREWKAFPPFLVFNEQNALFGSGQVHLLSARGRKPSCSSVASREDKGSVLWFPRMQNRFTTGWQVSIYVVLPLFAPCHSYQVVVSSLSKCNKLTYNVQDGNAAFPLLRNNGKIIYICLLEVPVI